MKERFSVAGEGKMGHGAEHERIGFSGGGTSKYLMGWGVFSRLPAA
jgi:hypothetical protein